MSKQITNYKNQKIGVLGLGEENVALTRFLVNSGAKVVICDQKTKGELGEYYQKIKDLRVQFRLGPHYLDHLDDFATVFRTPGLPYLDPKIQKAKEVGVKISSQTKLFFKLCPCPIIGVTGTKGKGTTTALLGEILKKAPGHVFVGGNIGNPPIKFIDELTKDDIAVLELSSFQLHDLDESPHIAVVLDIKVDHLDVHKDEAEYVEAKRNIVRFQTKNDFAVINADYLTSVDLAASSLGKIYWFSRRKSVDPGCFILHGELILRTDDGEFPIAKTAEVQLRGEHNLENVTAAITAGYLAGARIDSIKNAVKEFRGLEHRLEFVAEIEGVKYYNDSFSTTPDTTVAAIKSFSEPIVLLLGGSEKNADYSKLSKIISESSVKTIIAIGQTANRIIKSIHNNNIGRATEIQPIEKAVQIAKTKARPGDVVLLSPASASFDYFKNYKERGKIFKQIVQNL